MPLTLKTMMDPIAAARDAEAKAASTRAAVLALEASQEAAKLEAEQAARDAEKAAQAERQYRKKSAAEVAAALTTLRGQLDAAVGDPPTGRPAVITRARARAFVTGAVAEALFDVAQRDPTVDVLHRVQMAAGHLIEEALDEESKVAADALECAAWRATLGRLRVLAGELEQ